MSCACLPTQTHRIEKGDTLYSIAKKYRTNIEGLLHINPQIGDPNIIRVGDTLNVPQTSLLISKHVKSGDTLYSIIKEYNSTLEELKINERLCLKCLLAYNPQIKDPNKIYPGMKIWLPEIL